MNPSEAMDALLDQGIDAETHHSTLKKACKELMGTDPTKEQVAEIRELLRIRQAQRTNPIPSGFPFRVDPRTLSRPKVAIVGFTTHREEAFKLGPEWEIWGINELHRHHDVKLFHRWFEIHDRDDFEPQGEDKPGDPEHLKQLAGFDIPVYMHRHWPDVPPSVPFPKQQIEEFWNERGKRGSYQTSSISWEVALALMMGAEQVGIFGVDMANQIEYIEQRNCLEYWIGIAESVTGKPVVLPVTSDLCMAIGQYGYKDAGNQLYTKLEEREAWLHSEDNKRLAILRQLESEFDFKQHMLEAEQDYQRKRLEREYRGKREGILKERHEFFGGLQDVSYIKRSLLGTKPGVAGAPTPDRSQDPQTGIAPSSDGG